MRETDVAIERISDKTVDGVLGFCYAQTQNREGSITLAQSLIEECIKKGITRPSDVFRQSISHFDKYGNNNETWRGFTRDQRVALSLVSAGLSMVGVAHIMGKDFKKARSIVSEANQIFDFKVKSTSNSELVKSQ